MDKKFSLATKMLFFFGSILRKSGLKTMRRLASVIGFLLWICLPSRRHLAIDSIRSHLGLDETEAKKIARQSFTQNARSFLETAFVPCFTFDHPNVRVSQPEILKQMSNGERPVIAATAHMGAWELLAGLFGDFSQEYPHLVVVRHYRNAAMNEFTSAMRGSRGAKILGHRDAVFPVLRALKKNGMVAFLVDHNSSRDESLFLPFLGELAAVNKGPALLAARANALVYAIFLIRQGEDYQVEVEKVVDSALLSGDHDARIASITKGYTQAVERIIQRFPDQWFWMHKRWKTRLHGEDD